MKTRRIAFATILVVSATFVFFSFKKEHESVSKQPNLVIVIADQWRGQALGFLGKEPVLTPHLDSLAKHSLTLANFVSNYPVCSPARGMLMTGQYPIANHVTSNVTSRTAPFHVQLATDATCWSDVLKQHGYSLGYIGKWHLDSPHPPYIPTSNNRGKVKWNEWTPPNRRHGFDFWYAYGAYGVHTKPMYWSTNASRMDFHYVDKWEGQHSMEVAMKFLKNENGTYRQQGKPFGLVVSINIPHTPYQLVPQKYHDLYKGVPVGSLAKDPDIPAAGTPMGDAYRKNIPYYYAGITGLDEQIGRLLGVLRQDKLDDNTIFLVIADHGDCVGKHNQPTKNNIYEESLRVPFILYWKGHVLPRTDSQCMMSYPDIYPTLLDMMGLKKDIPDEVEGKSRAAYLLDGKGKCPDRQFIMGNIGISPKTGSLELGTGFRGIRTAGYKLAYQYHNDQLTGFLFNLKNDPFEMNNLFGRNHKITDSLKNELVHWLVGQKDPFVKTLH